MSVLQPVSNGASAPDTGSPDSQTLVVWYSHVSPWSYFGHRRVLDLAASAGVAVDLVPVSMGMVLPLTGGLPLAKRSPQRRAYRLQELARWSEALGMPIHLEPAFFPTDDTVTGRMAALVRSDGRSIADLSEAFMRACWAEQRDIADRDTVVAIASDCGFDGAALHERAMDDAAMLLLQQHSHAAVARGCFGVPWYQWREQGFWGQDRLEQLAVALRG
jgi:2-hydroxychromene-2-carboxylate isomerase